MIMIMIISVNGVMLKSNGEVWKDFPTNHILPLMYRRSQNKEMHNLLLNQTNMLLFMNLLRFSFTSQTLRDHYNDRVALGNGQANGDMLSIGLLNAPIKLKALQVKAQKRFSRLVFTCARHSLYHCFVPT